MGGCGIALFTTGDRRAKKNARAADRVGSSGNKCCNKQPKSAIMQKKRSICVSQTSGTFRKKCNESEHGSALALK